MHTRHIKFTIREFLLFPVFKFAVLSMSYYFLTQLLSAACLMELWCFEYAKTVQEGINEQVHVVREEQLGIIFTSQLKILSWEFCARKYDDYLSRRLVNCTSAVMAAKLESELSFRDGIHGQKLLMDMTPLPTEVGRRSNYIELCTPQIEELPVLYHKLFQLIRSGLSDDDPHNALNLLKEARELAFRIIPGDDTGV